MKRSNYAKLFENTYNTKKQDKKEREKQKKIAKREAERKAQEQQMLMLKQQKERIAQLAATKQKEEIDKVFNKIIKCACGAKIFFDPIHFNDFTGKYIPLSAFNHREHRCWNKKVEKASGIFSGLYSPPPAKPSAASQMH